MNKVKVYVIQTKLAETRVEGGECRVVSVTVIGELGCHVQLLAIDSRSADAFADSRLVLIESGGVDQTVTNFDRRGHGLSGARVVGPVNT